MEWRYTVDCQVARYAGIAGVAGQAHSQEREKIVSHNLNYASARRRRSDYSHHLCVRVRTVERLTAGGDYQWAGTSSLLGKCTPRACRPAYILATCFLHLTNIQLRG